MSATLTETLHHSHQQGVSTDVMEFNTTNYGNGSTTGVCEIEEEVSETHHNHHDGSMVVGTNISEEEEEEEDSVYVAVGKSQTSMEALQWTLNNLATPHSTILYLVHVFPQIKHIPNPRKLNITLFLSSFQLPSRMIEEQNVNLCQQENRERFSESKWLKKLISSS